MGKPTTAPAFAGTAPGRRVTPWQRLVEWLLPALVLLPTTLLPLARDQGVFAYGGQVILDGGVPYRDFIDQKGPATHYTFALALALLGQTAVAVRLLFFFVMLAGAQLAAAVAGRLGGTAARLPAALAYALVSLQGPAEAAWMSAQVEDILLPLFFAAVLLLGSAAAMRSRWRLFLAGLLLGLSCLYKPTAVFTAAGLAVVVTWWLVRRSQLPWGGVVRNLGWAAVGFVLLPALAAAYLAAQPGAMAEFWAVVEFNACYAGLKDGTWRQAGEVFGARWAKITPLALWGLLELRDRKTLCWHLFGAVLATSALAVFVQRKFFIIYQWTPLVGCLAVLAGLGVGRLTRQIHSLVSELWLGRVLTGMAAASVLLLLVPVSPAFAVGMGRAGAEVALGEMSVAEFRAGFPCGRGTARDLDRATAYVVRHTQPGDTVLVWGYEPAINFESGRRSPSRFMVERWLTIPGVPRQAEWRAEFVRDLRARRPLYVLVVNDTNRPWYVPNPVDALKQFPEFEALLRQQYRREAELVGITFFRRVRAVEG
jgi:hypothetical protein